MVAFEEKELYINFLKQRCVHMDVSEMPSFDAIVAMHLLAIEPNKHAVKQTPRRQADLATKVEAKVDKLLMRAS